MVVRPRGIREDDGGHDPSIGFEACGGVCIPSRLCERGLRGLGLPKNDHSLARQMSRVVTLSNTYMMMMI